MIVKNFPALVASLALFAGFNASAQIVRSGNVFACDVTKDCSQETIDGQQFYVIQSPQLLVKIALPHDPKFNRVVVTVENRASFDIHVDPSDFRIEMMEPKFKRLSYLDPDKLHLPKIKQPRPAVTKSFAATPNVPMLPDGRTFLGTATLHTTDHASGEVFFERASGPASMNLLLPIGGAIFQFVYTQTK